MGLNQNPACAVVHHLHGALSTTNAKEWVCSTLLHHLAAAWHKPQEPLVLSLVLGLRFRPVELRIPVVPPPLDVLTFRSVRVSDDVQGGHGWHNRRRCRSRLSRLGCAAADAVNSPKRHRGSSRIQASSHLNRPSCSISGIPSHHKARSLTVAPPPVTAGNRCVQTAHLCARSAGGSAVVGELQDPLWSLRWIVSARRHGETEMMKTAVTSSIPFSAL